MTSQKANPRRAARRCLRAARHRAFMRELFGSCVVLGPEHPLAVALADAQLELDPWQEYVLANICSGRRERARRLT